MGSGSSQQQQSSPGTLSPVTATLLSLFGGQPTVNRGQFVPTSFGEGGVFGPGSFNALSGLLNNQPLTGTEQGLIGGTQAAAAGNAQLGQDLLNRAAAGISVDPTASIAAAQRGFTQDTLPAILEKAPGFSSSDLQREVTRAGVDLQTNIAALKEAHQQGLMQSLPGFASAVGTNLLDQASQNLGFGQLSRQLVTDTSPAGDAFRVLTALQSLTGPGLTNLQVGKSKSTGVL